ncbi:acyltransferase domain-containing protein [Paenibacillus sp. LHD-117]|uniref:acyltransferase domain-containing protein n=1 Tax=Paenibacillus sp. LHD-117 TaxID=3071412 RepID=UPI0027E1D38B|nr:acyltransferase domain-containing protein [Paenibacillus sp. LHD-117]MDQ6419111.1 acyltransferase domain-containing protein [Paenibacillus sp. LHD-117]
MDIQSLCEGIGLEGEARRQLAEESMDEPEYIDCKSRFIADPDGFFKSINQTVGYRRRLLEFFVRLAMDAHREYQMRDISDDVYFDTFTDIRIWCEICKRTYGEYGIQEYSWLQEHVRFRLFRLGRLQFQPYAFDRDLDIDGFKVKSGQVVLNVHIPEGEPLSPESAERSFRQAESFFRGIPPVFMCRSWLLYPGLERVLKPDSNILRFQRMFRIHETDETSKQAEERIFGRTQEIPSEYEASTSLQRAAKADLMAGGKLGSGFGIRIGT